MMEAKLFLKDKLQKLADRFENVKLSYFFDNSYLQHVIVVAPSNIYSDDFFAKEQVSLEIDFINNFPYESLYFVEKENIEIVSQFEFECSSSHEAHLIFNQLSESFLSELLFNIPAITINSSGSYSKINNQLSENFLSKLLFNAPAITINSASNNYSKINNQFSEDFLSKLLFNVPAITVSSACNSYSKINHVGVSKIAINNIDDLFSQSIKVIKYGGEISHAMAA